MFSTVFNEQKRPEDAQQGVSATLENAGTNCLRYKGLNIDPLLFERGIIAVRPESIHSPRSPDPETTLAVGQDSPVLHIGTKELFFSSYAQRKQKTTPATRALIDLIASRCETQSEKMEEDSTVLINKQHREEIFFPLRYSDNGQAMGFYLYPWLSHKTPPQALNFKYFVAGGCMLGSHLTGMDQNENSMQLIKNHISFFPDQQIQEIMMDSIEPNPYEIVTFKELRATLSLIARLSNNKLEDKRLDYHLPYYDYVLFVTSLFVEGRVTYAAFNQLCRIMVKEAKKYKDQIFSLCKEYGIENVRIQSPFDNLFGSLEDYEKDKEPAKKICATLGLHSEEYQETPLEGKYARLQVQLNLFSHCLRQLKSNTHNPAHQVVWQHLLEGCMAEIRNSERNPCAVQENTWRTIMRALYQDASVSDEMVHADLPPDFKPIKRLIQIAHAMLLAQTCKSAAPYEACSIVHYSEKQIQVKFSSLPWPPDYAPMVHLTILERVLAYQRPRAHLSHKTKEKEQDGLLFYFNAGNNTSFSELLEKEKILEKSYYNIGKNPSDRTAKKFQA